MLMTRITDDAYFPSTEDNKIISFERNNRKNNITKQFKLSNGKIEIIENELLSKMIPKDKREDFNVYPFYLIDIGNDNVVIQVINNMCKLVVYNEDEDIFETKNIVDVMAGESIPVYDSQLNDFNLETIKFIGAGTNDLNGLSDYIMYSETNGLIINNLFFI